jgi:hypothetical protein
MEETFPRPDSPGAKKGFFLCGQRPIRERTPKEPPASRKSESTCESNPEEDLCPSPPLYVQPKGRVFFGGQKEGKSLNQRPA